MIVKFFKASGRPKSCMDYLKNKPDDHAKILKGDADLSQKIAESTSFKNQFTAGCLSFEETELSDQHKHEIMDKFEKTFFKGLESEQYNICWIQHTDKNRIELNFFIPNVELKSQKRLQPYFDRADRPLAENFKQVINYEYQLTDPNHPTKKQLMIHRQDLPNEKKEALKAIESGLIHQIQQNKIQNRDDVIQTLEQSGFEIARINKQSLSIKTDGQNLRLKGDMFNEHFRVSTDFRQELTRKVERYEQDYQRSYREAQEKLRDAIKRRSQYFRRRYEKATQKASQGKLEHLLHSSHRSSDPSAHLSHSDHSFRVGNQRSMDRDKSTQTADPTIKGQNLGGAALCEPKRNIIQRRSFIHTHERRKNHLHSEKEISQNTEQRDLGKLTEHDHDRNRDSFTKRIADIIERAKQTTRNFIEKITGSSKGERRNQSRKQDHHETLRKASETIDGIGSSITNETAQIIIKNKEYKQKTIQKKNRNHSIGR